MPPEPVILAFDTAAAHCAAVVVQGGETRASRVEPMQKGQAERLFPLLKEVLAEAHQSWTTLTAIAVCTGPGNFTGIRISVSAARGLALSLNIPAIGISRLEAMAYGTTGPTTALVDARQSRVYHQDFQGGAPISDVAQSPIADFTAHSSLLFDSRALTLPGTLIDAATITQNLAHRAIPLLSCEQPKPAPLYIRAPDAALPSEPPPTILP